MHAVKTSLTRVLPVTQAENELHSSKKLLAAAAAQEKQLRSDLDKERQDCELELKQLDAQLKSNVLTQIDQKLTTSKKALSLTASRKRCLVTQVKRAQSKQAIRERAISKTQTKLRTLQQDGLTSEAKLKELQYTVARCQEDVDKAQQLAAELKQLVRLMSFSRTLGRLGPGDGALPHHERHGNCLPLLCQGPVPPPRLCPRGRPHWYC